jgi:toxin ParE1/3/4
MKILWSREAIEHLASLRAYIAEDDPAAAHRIVLHIIQSVERLIPDNPQIRVSWTGTGHPRTRHCSGDN